MRRIRGHGDIGHSTRGRVAECSGPHSASGSGRPSARFRTAVQAAVFAVTESRPNGAQMSALLSRYRW